MGRCRPCLHPQTGHRYVCAYYWWFVFLAIFILAAIILISIGATIVQKRIDAEDFLPTNCTGTGAEDKGHRDCSCGSSSSGKHKQDECHSSFPCVILLVSYEDTSGNLHEDASAYQEPDRLGEDCSYSHCDKSVTTNQAKIDWFVKKYTNTTFSCYYNPADFKEVYIERNTEILHFLLWPGLVCGLCLLVTLALTALCVEARSRSTKLYSEAGKPVVLGSNAVRQMGAGQTNYGYQGTQGGFGNASAYPAGVYPVQNYSGLPQQQQSMSQQQQQQPDPAFGTALNNQQQIGLQPQPVNHYY